MFTASRYVEIAANGKGSWGSAVATWRCWCVSVATTSSQSRGRHDTVRAPPAEWENSDAQ
jgi:hypothetical protein